MNRTDVETHCESFGLPRPAHLLPSHSSDRMSQGYSFAKNAQADAAQLARLPGFGLNKVVRLKDAFKRPSRTSTAVDTLPAVLDADGFALCFAHPA